MSRSARNIRSDARSTGIEGARTVARRCAVVVTALFLLAQGGTIHASGFTLPPPERYTLENGLEVILQQDLRQPTVAVVMSYRVGSRDDPAGYAGLAHMVEHMTFRGSRHLEPLQMLSALERAGARDANAATHPDWTAFYSVLPASQVPLALWLESERMAFTLEAMTQEGFELEREVVRNERRQRGGLGSRVPDFVNHALYPQGHVYHAVASDETAEETFTLDHVRWFYQHWYRPDTATLTLVGSFDPDRARAEIAQYFGPIRAPTAAPPRAPAPVVGLVGQAQLDVWLDDRRDRVSIAWSAPCVIAECGAELLMLESVLVGTSESPLESALVGRGKPASAISLDISPYETHTRVTLDVDVALGEDPKRVVAVTDRILGDLRGAVSEAELRGARIALATHLTAAFEPLLSRAFALTHYRLPGRAGTLYDPAVQLERVDAFALSDLEDAARRYLPLDRRVVVYQRQRRGAAGEGELGRVVGRALPAQDAR